MHSWGDTEVDWAGISDAAEFIYKYLIRWGHVPVRDHKEKYGTVRVYTTLGWERGWLIQHLFYPNHLYYRFPQWIRKIDYLIPTHWLNTFLYPYHKWLYRRAYDLAVQKWPHLFLEIVIHADYPELLSNAVQFRLLEISLEEIRDRITVLENKRNTRKKK